MDGRKRTVQIKFRVTEAERDLILEKMKLVPTRNMAAYLRKIAIDGYIIQVDHEAAAKALKTAGITKLPNPATLQKEYEALQAQKEALYADYGKLKKKVREYDVIKQNIDSILQTGKQLADRYGRRVIILLDEYDTPMQEAYVHGYWAEFTTFVRSLFNATFKTNPYLERAMMTGITRVSKESIFSDLNNLRVVTTTSDLYAECFGFTEKEVFASLDEFGMGDKKDVVKQWYDGFIFGGHRDIYNPWSITNYLKEKKLRPYWADTSSNGLAGKLIRTASPEIKEYMEDLLNGQAVTVNFDEQMVFEQLDYNENAIWSLLLASGYLKAEEVEYRGITLKPWYQLRITNLETVSMFDDMFRGWFEASEAGYSSFVKALMQGDLEAMNYYMNKVSLATFSHFDVGGENSESLEPERFYHGFVLGLMAERAECYQIRSNRESGFGRYDVMMIPKNREKDPAIIIEFKVCSRVKKETLEDAVQEALKQIVDKKYDAELVALGVPQERIRHYGFAFAGKNVLIGAE